MREEGNRWGEGIFEKKEKMVVQLFVVLNQIRAYWFIIFSQITFS